MYNIVPIPFMTKLHFSNVIFASHSIIFALNNNIDVYFFFNKYTGMS